MTPGPAFGRAVGPGVRHACLTLGQEPPLFRQRGKGRAFDCVVLDAFDAACNRAL